MERVLWRDYNQAILPDTTEPQVLEVDLKMFVDNDHAGNKVTRRSKTGYMIFYNMALINWLSKAQPTLESSVFGAELMHCTFCPNTTDMCSLTRVIPRLTILPSIMELNGKSFMERLRKPFLQTSRYS